MTGFDFDQAPSPGTNRHAPATDCPTCGGDRLVPVHVAEPKDGYPGETYARCPDCNPAPTNSRQPVQGARWQDYDR